MDITDIIVLLISYNGPLIKAIADDIILTATIAIDTASGFGSFVSVLVDMYCE